MYILKSNIIGWYNDWSTPKDVLSILDYVLKNCFTEIDYFFLFKCAKVGNRKDIINTYLNSPHVPNSA